MPRRDAIREALAILGIRRLALSIHDASFPSTAAEDLGRGAPSSTGALELARFAADRGFDAIQLGPQGQTSPGNRSPYDATLWTRNVLSISLHRLARHLPWCEALSAARLDELVEGRPRGDPARVQHEYVERVVPRALEAVHDEARRRESEAGPRALLLRARAFAAEHDRWLGADALHELLSARHGTPDFARWRDGADEHLDARLFAPREGEEAAVLLRRGVLLAAHAPAIERYAFTQLLARAQQRELRDALHSIGVRMLGDLQAGVSFRDRWSRRGLFLSHHALGAPPSRTNPDGQPWGYPVLDPARAGAARAFVHDRVADLLSEADGMRIDHPHGLVCPWVYRAESADPVRAVQTGARLHSSPDLPDHPELAAVSIVSPDQLDRSVARHADGWVRELTEEQVERYGVLVGAVLDAAREHGVAADDVAFEVLSTCPAPLARVLDHFGLGRFRVTQKADPRDERDVYRGENAAPQDWIMLGNHDTRPIWLVVDDWLESGTAAERATYLASRLVPDADARPGFAATLARDRRRLAQAAFAELFVGPARNVLVFFADLFGLREVYNEPGTVRESNWSLRLPSDWRSDYERRLERGEALDIAEALALALRARGVSPSGELAGLARTLEGR